MVRAGGVRRGKWWIEAYHHEDVKTAETVSPLRRCVLRAGGLPVMAQRGNEGRLLVVSFWAPKVEGYRRPKLDLQDSRSKFARFAP